MTKLFVSLLVVAFSFNYFSQGSFSGNIESTFQYLNADSVIGANQPPEKALLNSYMNVFYTNGNFRAGMRAESYLPRIQGYPDRFDGTGIGMRYVGYGNDFVDVTLGSIYEQFGTGLALRSYEDRALGYDNVLDGIRLIVRPYKGVTLKSVYGYQRLTFREGRVERSDGIVRAIDAEVHLNESFPKMKDFPLDVVLGGSFVSKYQRDDNPDLVLPENVGAYGGRTKLRYKNLYFDVEYIQKEQDPSADNLYNYNWGHACVFNFTYTKKGLGILFSGKSVDNMSFRSDRTKDLQDVFINYLPSLNKTHTYNLVATLYPYATQPLGEVAYQVDVLYTFKKGTKLGGKTGLTLSANVSTTFEPIRHTTGFAGNQNRVNYRTLPFDKSDSLYWRDINFNITKKINKQFSFIVSYFNININNDVAKISNDAVGIIASHIGVLEMAYKINTKNSLRAEFQGLHLQKKEDGSINDKGDWATVLLEYTISPNYFFSFMNQYNFGNPSTEKRVHYPIITCGYIREATRFTVSYGRQRAGLFCVGGVCRFVPANNGLTLSFTQSF